MVGKGSLIRYALQLGLTGIHGSIMVLMPNPNSNAIQCDLIRISRPLWESTLFINVMLVRRNPSGLESPWTPRKGKQELRILPAPPIPNLT